MPIAGDDPAMAAPGARRSTLRTAVGICLVVGWVIAAWLLQRTTVPRHLDLGSVDVRRVFGPGLVDEARRYERVALGVWVLSEAALIGVLWAYARRGAAFTRESAAGPIGTGMLLGMLGLGILWSVQLPFGLAALWWDRRNDVSEISYLEWVFGGWLTLAGAFVSICIALLIVMALARWVGEWWWLPGAAVFVAIATVFAFGAPYLTTGLGAPDDPRLVTRYERLAARERVRGVPLREESVSGDTSQANAYAFGLGSTRKIVVWDTLLDGRFSTREVDVVLAHELGHHAARHIAKALGWFALFALPAAWALMRVTRSRGGMGEPAAIPVALFAVALITLVLAPAQNWISRGMESDADWRALEATRDPTAARGLFIEFARTSLGDPSPPTWAYLLLATHPTLEQRVAMADAWARRTGG